MNDKDLFRQTKYWRIHCKQVGIARNTVGNSSGWRKIPSGSRKK